ncbi:MAG TPA: FHA domain-containing protein [Marmoricola sp.]
MGAQLAVEADLRFSLERPGARGLHGSLTSPSGPDGPLELRLDDPVAFAGRADALAVRAFAAMLATRGLVMHVVTGQGTLLELGAVRSSWWQHRLTGSRHLRVAGSGGAWAALRGRFRTGAAPALPDRRLAPPATPYPLAPTFLRRRRWPVAGTHAGGGNPRLVLSSASSRLPESPRPEYSLTRPVTMIGSDPDCDIRIDGLRPLHAVVRHDASDEYLLVDVSHGHTRVNGELVRQRILRTGSRIDLGAGEGATTLSFRREEYADHGRPYGGRIGGELGHQKPQPTPRPAQRPARGAGR